MTDYAEFCRRMAICRACPFITSTLTVERCKRCSCVLVIKAKMGGCPEGKW